jgi:5-methylcytosine-specific restriction endonuclease McrA
MELHPRTKWPASRVYFPECVICGTVFTARTSRQRACTAECRRRAGIQSTLDRYHNDDTFRDLVLSRAHARRADKLGLATAAVLLSYLVKRDRGRCGICHKPVRAKRGPMRPSIDHIIPLNCGGTHELTNVQLAHYRCNLSKNDRGGGEQLLLVG